MLRDLQWQTRPPHLPELPCGRSVARLRGHETCFIEEGVRSVGCGADGGDGRAEQVAEFELAGGVRGSGEGLACRVCETDAGATGVVAGERLLVPLVGATSGGASADGTCWGGGVGCCGWLGEC